MNILEINAMKGPNYWSIRRHKLIVMRLDLEDYEEKPTNKIPGFLERLKTMLPSLHEHRCSEGYAGGFYHRVEEGTWMGHVIEHIALEIQTLAGMEVGFGRTRETGVLGQYNVVFAYLEEEVGRYAARAAVRIAVSIAEAKDYDLDADIQEMRILRERNRLGPSTDSIVQEAISRGIPWIRLNKYSLCQLGYGANQKRIQATVTSQTSSIAVEIACDKEDTKTLLEGAEVPVPKGDIIKSEAGLEDALRYIRYPVVIKPINGNHGRGITVNINNWEEALFAFEAAKKVSNSVIVEKYIVGDDYRLLVIDNKLVAAAKRTPARVIGNGKHNIQELVDNINADPRRGYGHENVLTQIDFNDLTLNIISSKGYTLETILAEGEILNLKDTANLSTGGTAEDVLDAVHPYNVFMAERIARLVGLDVCGIDIMTSNISMPLSETGGAVLEVNAAPGFRMHLAPTEGLPRNVAANVVDMLFPPGTNARIPIVAVTGTNGKTTTTRLIAHMVKMMGFHVGFTTTDGVYIQNHLMMTGDCTGPASAEFVLKDPSVNFAVLECARGGILRAGLGFHHCDMAVVTNVAADHLGLKGINTVEQMSRVKGVVVESVRPEGYSILNADDENVYNMKDSVQSKIALFSMDENNPRIKEHAKNGGLSAIYENGFITIYKGEWKIRVQRAVNIPLTYGGRAGFMIQNILPAVLVGFLNNFKIDDIRMALESFIPSPSTTPGRLNWFRFKDFDVILDYAHNPAGLRALHNFIDKIDSKPKVGIIAGIGDRRDEDNMEIGKICAEMFDELIIRQDKHLRGKKDHEIIDLLVEGIHQHDKNKPVKIIPKESEAISHAIENASPGTLIVICSDVVTEALKLVQKYKEEEANLLYDYKNVDIPNIEDVGH